ncbi:hypothetical protein SAMN05216464_103224 [Mucilaginibacter pineti]|uniref:Uncharacterized protein n=1 Tax=Mucilaginibacter pineti TaxID=1391627 RepID=A0A1G6Z7L9_9SPHI|nr:hypothetical protein [Mucilaginibacter pineti]SDD97865.1 hypothetical protein SAMN05216464_103224 [Mucilaginibacter pineti]
MPLPDQTQELISVDHALNKGREMLLWPRILLIIGLFIFLFPLTLFFIALKDGPVFSRNLWLVFGAVLLFTFVIGFFLPFLFLSKRTTRWKLWAFAQVNDVQELKKAARRAALCTGYGTFMDRLQIQSAGEREQWRRLQERTDAPGIFIDDPETPAETTIYYNRTLLIIHILLGLMLMGVGIVVECNAFRPGTSKVVSFFGALLILLPLYLVVRTLQNLIKHQPRIIFSSKGIYTVETGFQSWDHIIDISLEIINQGRRGVKHVFNFRYADSFAHIDVTAYSKRNQLESLVRVYRGRYQNGI